MLTSPLFQYPWWAVQSVKYTSLRRCWWVQWQRLALCMKGFGAVSGVDLLPKIREPFLSKIDYSIKTPWEKNLYRQSNPVIRFCHAVTLYTSIIGCWLILDTTARTLNRKGHLKMKLVLWTEGSTWQTVFSRTALPLPDITVLVIVTREYTHESTPIRGPPVDCFLYILSAETDESCRPCFCFLLSHGHGHRDRLLMTYF